MLPDYLATALNLVGIPWPNIDEDELRHCAGDLREFASSLTDSVKDTSGVVSDTSGQTDAAFAQAFAAQWEGRPGEITVISDGADVLAVALGVIAGAVETAKDAVLIALGALATTLGAELIFTGGLADLVAGGAEVEIAERAVKAALDVLEQQVVGQLINAAIHPLTDRIPATVRKFLAGSAEAVPAAVALKADYTQLGMAATQLDTHAHRTDTTGATLQRRSSSRNFAKGGSPIGATLKQALETVLKDLAEQIPKVLAQVQRDMAQFLKKAATVLEQADTKLAADARALEKSGVGHPGHSGSDDRVEPRREKASFGEAESKDYRETFFKEHPDKRGKVVVHHAVEQQARSRYPKSVSDSELHSLENLRGILKGDINNRVHLSEIRKEWNRFYRENPSPTKQDLLDQATKIDNEYGHHFDPPVR